MRNLRRGTRLLVVDETGHRKDRIVLPITVDFSYDFMFDLCFYRVTARRLVLQEWVRIPFLVITTTCASSQLVIQLPNASNV